MRERFLGSSSRLPARAESALRAPDLAEAHQDARWLAAYTGRVARELGDVAWPDLPAAIIHGDFRVDNLLFREGSLAAVLDFDLATRDVRVTDLAVAVHYLAQREDPTSVVEPRLVSALVAGYEEVTQLAPAERRAACVLVEVKAARAPMRMLRHVVKAGRPDRPSLVGRLARDVRRLRGLDEDPAWRRALTGPATAGERDP